ncbi:hypothetical protein GCM10011515_04350 [Tsuneonella deserti]|uniref:Uncharacterized protein n=1 Tax=Tsuneonella deserti TaxID=2035528 RepID=A0ABQ1S2Z5_9SPHN|nr:hypothetical protein GCM10011515_04350 [Tsuneonella deserti]
MRRELADKVRELALGPPADELPAIDGAQAGAVIAAVFHPPQPVDQPVGDLVLANYAYDAAHFLKNPVTRPRLADKLSAFR